MVLEWSKDVAQVSAMWMAGHLNSYINKSKTKTNKVVPLQCDFTCIQVLKHCVTISHLHKKPLYKFRLHRTYFLFG